VGKGREGSWPELLPLLPFPASGGGDGGRAAFGSGGGRRQGFESYRCIGSSCKTLVYINYCVLVCKYAGPNTELVTLCYRSVEKQIAVEFSRGGVFVCVLQ